MTINQILIKSDNDDNFRRELLNLLNKQSKTLYSTFNFFDDSITLQQILKKKDILDRVFDDIKKTSYINNITIIRVIDFFYDKQIINVTIHCNFSYQVNDGILELVHNMLINKIKNNYVVLGGYFFANEILNPSNNHAITFTVCDSKVFYCNTWGDECRNFKTILHKNHINNKRDMNGWRIKRISIIIKI